MRWHKAADEKFKKREIMRIMEDHTREKCPKIKMGLKERYTSKYLSVGSMVD